MSSALCSVPTPAMVYVPCTTLATSVCLVRLLPCFWIFLPRTTTPMYVAGVILYGTSIVCFADMSRGRAHTGACSTRILVSWLVVVTSDFSGSPSCLSVARSHSRDQHCDRNVVLPN